MAVITGLNTGERVTLLILLTKPDSGLVKNMNDPMGGTPLARATTEVARLRGTAAGVSNLDALFDATGNVADTNTVATALGFASDSFYDPSGPCPPAGSGDVAIFKTLSQGL